MTNESTPASSLTDKEREAIAQMPYEEARDKLIQAVQALEAGASLAYPENACYDGENGRRIYLECVKHASLVIRYARSAADVLRAHMLLVLLHAAYGNSEAAEEHAEQFPVRADMTVYAMQAVLAHFRNDRRAESAARRQALAYQTEALLDGIAALAGCYAELGQNDDAWHTLSAALSAPLSDRL